MLYKFLLLLFFPTQKNAAQNKQSNIVISLPQQKCGVILVGGRPRRDPRKDTANARLVLPIGRSMPTNYPRVWTTTGWMTAIWMVWREMGMILRNSPSSRPMTTRSCLCWEARPSHPHHLQGERIVGNTEKK